MYDDSIQHHVQALCIAAASSTDNFLVGLVLGTTHSNQWHHALVWGIAWCNAAGSYVATATGSSLPLAGLQHVVAGTAFGYLGFKEYRDNATADEKETKPNTTDGPPPTTFWQLALPMSLNNLAGGVATGVAGVSSLVASGYACWISALFMYAGLWLGARIHKRNAARHKHMAATASVVLYGFLVVQSFYEALSGS